MQAAHTVCTYAPPYHQKCWLLNWTLMTHWKVSLLFSPEDTTSVISNKNVLNEPWPTGHDSTSGPSSHMTFFLHDGALVGICRWHGGCVYRQWFLEVFLGPFCNANDRIMAMSDAVSSEGPKTTGIQQRSSVLSLTHRFLQFLWIFWWCYAL